MFNVRKVQQEEKSKSIVTDEERKAILQACAEIRSESKSDFVKSKVGEIFNRLRSK